MIKYAKIINEKTGLCAIGIGTDEEFYKSVGMTQIDVELSDKDNQYYVASKCPHKSDEEKKQDQINEEIKEIKQKLNDLDLKSIRALRENDTSYIEQYKQEAITLRQRLRELEG